MKIKLKKEVNALESLKPKKETKPIEKKSNNKKLKAEIILNNLISKRKYLMKGLHDSVNYRNLNFEYVDKKNNDLSFYGYKNSTELFNIIKNNQINFDDALKR